MTDQEIRDQLTPDAIGVLLRRGYGSYCNGSDRLVALGLWDEDGCPTEQCDRIVADLKREERRKQ